MTNKILLFCSISFYFASGYAQAPDKLIPWNDSISVGLYRYAIIITEDLDTFFMKPNTFRWVGIRGNDTICGLYRYYIDSKLFFRVNLCNGLFLGNFEIYDRQSGKLKMNGEYFFGKMISRNTYDDYGNIIDKESVSTLKESLVFDR